MEHIRNSAHNGVIYSIVARNTWQEFRFLLRGLEQFSRRYEKVNNVAVDYTLFKYIVDGVCEDTTESRELFWWCLNRGEI